MTVLKIENLKKSYRAPDGEINLVIDVPAFAMAAGEQIALEGGSGTGKTTFLNLIAGILQPDSGSVSIAGRDLARSDESTRDQIRGRHLGYVFQTFNLLQGFSALENVELAMMFGKGVNQPRAIDLLKRVGLADRMNYRPRQLSVGQQQRVAIARALANAPELVLADEPTGNLDTRNAAEALNLIREICKESGAALLLVSHDRSVLAQFERIESLGVLNKAAAARGATTEAPPQASMEASS